MACAPVPLTGQSSIVCPALANTFSAFSLSEIVKVLISTIVLGFSLALAMAPATSISACGFGRLVMIVGTLAATSAALSAISTPAPRASRRRAAEMS